MLQSDQSRNVLSEHSVLEKGSTRASEGDRRRITPEPSRRVAQSVRLEVRGLVQC